MYPRSGPPEEKKEEERLPQQVLIYLENKRYIAYATAYDADDKYPINRAFRKRHGYGPSLSWVTAERAEELGAVNVAQAAPD